MAFAKSNTASLSTRSLPLFRSLFHPYGIVEIRLTIQHIKRLYHTIPASFTILVFHHNGSNSFYTCIIRGCFQSYGSASAIYRHFKPFVNSRLKHHDIILRKAGSRLFVRHLLYTTLVKIII